MSNLPILEKNSYLSLVVSDNSIWAHLAYTDHNADREYILSDYTDLNPLRQRLDDEFFNKQFWFEYFNNLEKVFNWNIVDKNGYDLFSFRKFQNEGDGVNGIRIIMDENQDFFNKIFSSLREFSNDIALKIIDDTYMTNLVEGLAEKLDYDDFMYINLDYLNFKVIRNYKDLETKKRTTVKTKLNWNNEYGLIDSIKDARLRAFLGSDISSKEMLNSWSNFLVNRITACEDPTILDILRAYTTIQTHSMYQDSKEKLNNFGLNGKTGLVLTGMIPLILGKQKTLLSLIDGFEFAGTFDTYIDQEKRLLSYGKSYVLGPSSTDAILTRRDLLSTATKVYIPDMRLGKNISKVIFNGYTDSLEGEKQDIFVLSPEFTLIDLPLHREKLIIEGEFKNGASIRNNEDREGLSLISIPGKLRYSSLLIDARPKPIIYGPDVYSNKLKLQQWLK